MIFEEEYEKFIQHHASNRKGESLRRLLDGHGYGEKLLLEKIWWPAFKNFDFLYPEYAVTDMRYGTYYLDFAFIPDPPLLMLDLEADGFGPHVQQMDRRQFTDHLNRQNFLVAMDWKVLRFSIDEMKENPTRCIQYLQLLLGKYYGVNQPSNIITLQEREILRLCLKLGKPITAKDVATHLMLHRNTAYSLLRILAEKQWILPYTKGAIRVRANQANENKISHLLV
jgi:very-short-patch-repair endonuclease